MAILSKTLLKAALLVAAGSGLSGCVFDVGLGFASDGYYNDGHSCDPYGGYDAYYDCDYGQGFGNIGFGGGYYDSYFYPGYGVFLFDNVGRRYPMRDHHRRYWGERRHSWYREQRDRDGRRYDGGPRSYSSDATPGVYGGAERTVRRARDDDGVRKSRRSRNEQWRGGDRSGANAVAVPNANGFERPDRSREREGDLSRRERRNDPTSNTGTTRQPQQTQQDNAQVAGSAPRAVPTPRPDRTLLSVRRGRNDGETIRDR